jgi:imidazolonepropionase-like amidohydrolase
VIQRLRMGLEEARDFRPSRYRSEHDDYTRQGVAALQSFLESDKPLVLSVDRANEIEEALALAREFDIRLVIHGGAEAWKVADAVAEARVPVVVDVLDNIPLSYDQLGARIDNAALLHRAGVAVLFTAEDSHNARLVRQTAGNAVAEGMPWQAALAAVTRVPAEVYGLPPGTGTLAEGAPADLVIWSGDPLEITEWAEQVMVAGEWMPMESRQTRLFERYRDLGTGTPYGYR